MRLCSISEILRQSVASGSEQAWQEPTLRRKLIILMTPRSGSTWLGDIMKNTGVLGFPEEYLNPDFIPETNSELMAVTEYDYISGCASRRQTSNGVFAMEIVWGDIARLEKLDFFAFCQDAHFIWLRRKDILSQAISLFLASETGVFQLREENSEVVNVDSDSRAYQGMLEELRKKPDLTTEIRRIRDWVSHVIKDETQIECELTVREIKPLRLFYEDLTSDLHRTITSIFRFLELEQEIGGAYELQSMLKKTRGDVNHLLKIAVVSGDWDNFCRLTSYRPPLYT